MKKLAFLSFAALVVFASCKKDSSGMAANTATTSFSNAVYSLNTIYNDTAFYTVTGDTLVYSFTITTPDTTSAALLVTLVSANRNQLTGDYMALGNTVHYGYLTFFSSVSTEYEGGTNIGGAIVHVNSMSLTHVEGTVSGYVYLNGDNTQPAKAISASFNIVK